MLKKTISHGNPLAWIAEKNGGIIQFWVDLILFHPINNQAQRLSIIHSRGRTVVITMVRP